METLTQPTPFIEKTWGGFDWKLPHREILLFPALGSPASAPWTSPLWVTVPCVPPWLVGWWWEWPAATYQCTKLRYLQASWGCWVHIQGCRTHRVKCEFQINNHFFSRSRSPGLHAFYLVTEASASQRTRDKGAAGRCGLHERASTASVSLLTCPAGVASVPTAFGKSSPEDHPGLCELTVRNSQLLY